MAPVVIHVHGRQLDGQSFLLLNWVPQLVYTRNCMLSRKCLQSEVTSPSFDVTISSWMQCNKHYIAGHMATSSVKLGWMDNESEVEMQSSLQ